jgi:uncharacterized protein
MAGITRLLRAATLGVALAAAPAAAPIGADEPLVIGTASPEGVYFAAGRAMCFLLVQHEALPEGGCEARPTAGSIANLNAVLDGELEVALAQSDWQHHAVAGTGPFEARGPGEDLRAVFSLHSEPFTVVARLDSGIEGLLDLEGRRVNIGNPGSGQRATMEFLMEIMGWTAADFQLAEELPAEQQSLALCHDRVQALVYTVGHPNASINRVTGLCEARLVHVEGEAVDRLVAESPYYSRVTIPGSIYSNNPDPVRTFGVQATVVASAAVDEDRVYRLVRTIFESLEDFRRMHPTFGLLDREGMLATGLSAPFHDGALRYYREAGLLDEADVSPDG